jgi:protein TonB
MAQAHHLPPGGVPVAKEARPDLRPVSSFRFTSLVLTEPESRFLGLSTTLATSLLMHAVLILAVVLLPILFYDALPETDAAIRAFFVAPSDIAPPPPPPPPPAPSAAARVVRPKPATPQALEAPSFVAPIEIPDEIKPEEGLDLGIEGGVPGGVEGGVPGGVLGGVVGGLPLAPPPPPTARVVRIGGAIVAPKLIKKVAPVYPSLAAQARVEGIVVIEARVDTKGRMKTATVVRGSPLLDAAALEAVQQWRYQPLLLNGVPTEFILTVTVTFNLVSATP